MSKIYYEKVGAQYVPVSEYNSDWLDSFHKGTHLVMVYPGGQSRVFNIDPALAPMIAAGRFAEDAMARAMHKIAEGKPTQKALTPEQKAAWEQLKTVYGDELFSITFPSIHDVTQAGLRALEGEAQKMLTHPSVRDAYEQFMMMYKLTQDRKEEND